MKNEVATRRGAERMPALFVGHGSPMNAIEDNEFRRAWAATARRLPLPRAILCVSAHWESDGVRVTASPHPETIHDFQGFPRELFEIRYPAPGDPALAREVARLLKRADVVLDPERGLDHGCWSVLATMYPKADVPVVQLGLDTARPASFHYALAADLAPLRDEGVLVMGSGNIVHNLGLIDFHRKDGYDWAVPFKEAVKEKIVAGDHAALVDYLKLTPEARRAVPEPEHYLPLLYVLAIRQKSDEVVFWNDETVMGSVAMTSLTCSDRAPGPGASR